MKPTGLLDDFLARPKMKVIGVGQNDPGSADGNLLGATPASVESAMNAQIRALTKGDVTKESEVLALDTWRALTELNAQAREYKELNAKMQSK